MSRHTFDQFSPLIFMGVMVLVVGGAAWYVWSIFNPVSDFDAEDDAAIARYKEWLITNDGPFGGKIKPEDLPLVYRKVIEHDVKAGDLKTARATIGETIQKKLDEQVLALTQLPQARELIGQVRDAQRKVAALNEFVAALRKEPRPGDAELARLADAFCQVPFDAAACPEQAAEIARIYKESLVPLKDSPDAVKKVATDIQQRCLPRPPG
jgi:hypothetical protein